MGVMAAWWLLMAEAIAISIQSLFILNALAFCSNGTCQLMDPCFAPTDCAHGLYCANCPALDKPQPTCTRDQPTLPTSLVTRLPFNRFSWLVTHNSFSNLNSPHLPSIPRLTFYNQEDTVTNQLKNGVRGLMLDMYDFRNDIWLCHSFRGQCFDFTAFRPAIETLNEVQAFLMENPSDIVTIFIEDYVQSPKGLTNLFSKAGLDKHMFPLSKMPRKGADWPTVDSMISQNHRLLVFSSVESKESNEGIAYQWRYIRENEPGDGGVKDGVCSNRKESQPLNSHSASLFLQNYFPTVPLENESCHSNSAPLDSMVNTCYKSAANMLPNFLAINFYMRSDGGGVFDIIDEINGQMLCGCKTVLECQEGQKYGYCKNVAPPPYGSSPSPPNGEGIQFHTFASSSVLPPILFSSHSLLCISSIIVFLLL